MQTTTPGAVQFGAPLFADAVSTGAVVPAAKPVRARTGLISIDQIDQIGATGQSQLADLSRQLMSQVKASDVEVLGGQLNTLVATAKGLDPTKLAKKGIVGALRNIFGNAKEKLLAEYDTLDKRMQALVDEIDKTMVHHRKRIGDMEVMYTTNKAAHAAMEEAAKNAETCLLEYDDQLQDLRATLAPDNSFGAQDILEMQDARDRLAKRIDDVHRAMLLAQQFGPQLKLMQGNARSLVDKFTDAKRTTIPAWTNAFAMYILSDEQRKGAALATAVDDATDAALRMQADQLRLNTQSIAKSKARSNVSTETLQHLQTQLLGSFDDMKKIADEGMARRKEDASKLLAMEKELVERFSK